jgi:nucleotide-binding universal stress UspA family protein
MKPGILVPLDGTRLAEAALPLALYLAKRDGLPINLVTVWQPLLPLYDASDELEAWEVEAHAERHRYMADLASRLEGLGVAVSVKYAKGRPAELLPPLAEPGNAKLVVMATHGRGPVLRAGLGSVADQVVRKGSVPVLLVRPGNGEAQVQLAPAAPFRRVLVPLDGSKLAETALERSLFGGESEAIALTLLRVVSLPLPTIVAGGGFPPGTYESIVDAERAAAQEYLDGVAERLAPWGSVSTAVTEESSAGAGIVGYAAGHDVDLIAMATHGRGGAQRLLLGSVADKVIRTSTVPVLLSHPERAQPSHDVERLAGQVVGMP